MFRKGQDSLTSSFLQAHSGLFLAQWVTDLWWLYNLDAWVLPQRLSRAWALVFFFLSSPSYSNVQLGLRLSGPD